MQTDVSCVIYSKQNSIFGLLVCAIEEFMLLMCFFPLIHFNTTENKGLFSLETICQNRKTTFILKHKSLNVTVWCQQLRWETAERKSNHCFMPTKYRCINEEKKKRSVGIRIHYSWSLKHVIQSASIAYLHGREDDRRVKGIVMHQHIRWFIIMIYCEPQKQPLARFENTGDDKFETLWSHLWRWQ